MIIHQLALQNRETNEMATQAIAIWNDEESSSEDELTTNNQQKVFASPTSLILVPIRSSATYKSTLATHNNDIHFMIIQNILLDVKNLHRL